MKKTSILIILLVLFLLIVRKQEVEKSKIKPIEAVTVRYLNISNLFTTLHFPADWRTNPKFVKIRRWFDSEPELSTLRLESKFNVYEEGTDFFNQHYAGRVTVPSILIQKKNGDVIFAATGNNIPETSRELISRINLKVPNNSMKNDQFRRTLRSKVPHSTQVVNQFKRSILMGGPRKPYKDPYDRCNDPNCIDCNPKPKPTPISKPVIQAIPKKEDKSYLNYILVLVAGAATGIYSGTKSEGDEND